MARGGAEALRHNRTRAHVGLHRGVLSPDAQSELPPYLLGDSPLRCADHTLCALAPRPPEV